MIESLRLLDSQALTSVHMTYYPGIYRYALHRLGDVQLAEDLASETFSQLLSALHRQRGPDTNLQGWLFSTMNHLLHDHFRRKYRHNLVPLSASEHALAEEDPAFELDETGDLHRAMRSLTEEQQRVLSLRFGADFSLAETAEIMNKNPNAIKALQYRALKALRRELDKDERWTAN